MIVLPYPSSSKSLLWHLKTFSSTISSRLQYSNAFCIRRSTKSIRLCPPESIFGEHATADTRGQSCDDVGGAAVVVAGSCVGFEVEDMAYIGRTQLSIHE